MKNTFGDNITITLFGESHGSAIGAVIDGIAPGITVDEDKIAYKQMQLPQKQRWHLTSKPNIRIS